MTDFRKDLFDEIKTKRPNITDSSIKTYISCLSSLSKKLNEGKLDKTFFVHNKTEILKYLEGVTNSQTKKTILSALYILTGIEDFKVLMLDECNKVNNQYKEQKLKPDRENNRISFDEVKDKVNELYNTLNKEKSKENYINYLLVGLMSGIFTPPRRSEWAYVKIKDYNTKEDNYYCKGKFIFNKYKTFKKYGQQILDAPKELKSVINKWLKLNDSEYFFYNVNTGKPFTNSILCRRLYSIFNKKISVDQLRSIFLSDKYKDLPALKNMEDTATKMGNSIETQFNNYIKK